MMCHYYGFEVCFRAFGRFAFELNSHIAGVT